MAQPKGDIIPINQMYELWKAAKLGPIECKCRKEWSFNNLFKNPETSYLGEYWKKSNEDTGRDDTVLIFTKASVTDYVMYPFSGICSDPYISLSISGVPLVVRTLHNFLTSNWTKE